MRLKAMSWPAIAAVILATPALAQDGTGPQCGSFTLVRTFESIAFVDNGPVGKSPGDMRVLSGTLSDEDGAKVGSIHVVATLLAAPGPDGEDLTFAVLQEEFPNGTISSTSLTSVASADDESKGPGKPSYRAVTGGTGAFANVSGTITGTTRDDGKRMVEFDLSCD